MVSDLETAIKLIEQKRLGDAVVLMRQRVSDDPLNVQKKAELGYIFITAREPDLAVSILRSAEKLDPNNADVKGYLGQAYYFLGQHTDARRYLEEALRIDEDNVPALNGLGILETEEGNYKVADEILTRLLTKCGLLPPILTERAYVRAQQGRLEDAIVDCTKALGVDPTNVIALKSRSALYNQTGEFELAAKDRVKLDSFRNAHYLLGLIQKKEPKRDS